MSNDNPPPYLQVTGDSIYFRQRMDRSLGALSGHVDLALGVNQQFGSLVFTDKGVESAVSLSADEMRRLAGALLDASDAIDNAGRTGAIKYRNPNT